MTDAIEHQILHALFCLSRDTLPIDAGALGRATGVSSLRAARVLVQLERAGLVDASRARLTMLGLARAVSVDSGAGGKRPDLQAATRPPQPHSAPVPAAPADRERPQPTAPAGARTPDATASL